jgi:hypothetical protein
MVRRLGSVLWLVGIGALVATAAADDVLRVFPLRYVDAPSMAALLSGAGPGYDADAVAGRWAGNLVARATSQLLRLGPDRAPDPVWQGHADLLPPEPPEQSGRLAQILDMPELTQPPVALPSQNALVAKGSPEALDRLQEIVRLLDKPSTMVNVEVRVEDAPTHVVRGWGVDFHTWNGQADVGSAGNAPGAGAVLQWGLGRTDLLLGLENSEDRGRTSVGINATTTSGLPVEAGFGQVLPFFTANVWYDDFGHRRVDYEADAVFIGLQMWVLPTVLGDDTVRMVLRPSFSYWAGTVTSPRGDSIPIVRYQEVATTVTVADGQPLVIGGMGHMRDDAHRRFAGLLQDVRDADNSSPVMIVTPHIIRPEPRG